MKTTIKVILFFLITATSGLYGQANYYGVVLDSLDKPIEFANVMAIDTVDNTIASFGVTSGGGKFKLPLVANKTYLLKVSFVGFQNFEQIITGQNNKESPHTISLDYSINRLDDVEVIQELPVLISGDTIIYKADAFTQGNEKKLEDVLKKLPGFEVDENGEIKVQGRKVDKILVEGKQFFDGDTKMATKNLPANAIDKVQVLQDFNDVAPMSGLGNNNETLALNIKLKDGKKNMVFGDLTGGVGPEDRYLGHANVFYYSPKTTINLISDVNNIGEQAFSLRDYFRFNGGLSDLGGRSGSSFNISADNAGIPMAQRNNAQHLDSKFGALNYNYNPNKKWRLSGFMIGSITDNTLSSISERTYVGQAPGENEILTSESQVKNKSGMFKFKGKYSPNSALQIDYSAFVKASLLDNIGKQISDFSTFTNLIGTQQTQSPLSVEQQLQAFYAKNEKNIFSFQLTHQYKSQDPLYDLLTSERPFSPILPIIDGDSYNLLQSKNVESHKQESAFNYYRILNKTNHINFKFGNSYSYQELTSNIDQKIEGEVDNELNSPELINNVKYNFSDIFVGIGYKTKTGNLTFSPTVYFHQYNFENEQLDTKLALNKTMVLPSLWTKYDFRNSHSLSFNYSANAQFTDIQNIASGLIIQNYNTLFGGNRGLENSWYHQLSLNYFNFNMFNFFNIFGNLNYQKRFDGITNSVRYVGLDRLLFPTNIGVTNDFASGNISIDKSYNTFKIRASADLSLSNNNNLVDMIANKNQSFRQQYKGSIESTFLKGLNVEVGFEKLYNNYQSSFMEDTYITDRPFGNINLTVFKSFILNVDYEYNNYQARSSGQHSTYDLMNADLAYQKNGSSWEFKVAALNLLNTTAIRRDSFSESLSSTYAYFIQKRYYMFSIKYDL